MSPVEFRRRVGLLVPLDRADICLAAFTLLCTIAFVVSVALGTLQYTGVIS